MSTLIGMSEQPDNRDVPSWIELMGRHAASKVLSFSARVMTVRADETQEWEVWHAPGDRWRVEQNGEAVYLFDGTTAVIRQDDRMMRSRSDFHLPLLGNPSPLSFVGGHSLIESMSQKVVPSEAEHEPLDGRPTFAVDITRDDQPQVARVAFDADTGVLLRFGVDGVDLLKVNDLTVLDSLPDDTFVWDGAVEEAPLTDRDEIRRRAQEVPWIAVLVQMVHGPNPPVRGVIRSVGEDGKPRKRVGWTSMGGQPTPTIAGGVDASTVSVWRDGARLRIERPDSTPVLISDGTTCWRFREGETPTEAPASTLLLRGNGTELLARRPAADWAGSDFTHPAGTIEMNQRHGRSVYEFDLAPPPHKPHPLHMVVDAETGMVLSQSSPQFGIVDEWTQFEVVDSLDGSLFIYTGPSEPAEERTRRRRRAHDDDRDRRLDWFRQHVTAQPLTAQIDASFDVTYVHELDEDSGAFHASLGDHRHSGSLVRRVHSDEPWRHGLQDNARTWTSNGFDWALHTHDDPLNDDAFEQLRQLIEEK